MTLTEHSSFIMHLQATNMPRDDARTYHKPCLKQGPVCNRISHPAKLGQQSTSLLGYYKLLLHLGLCESLATCKASSLLKAN
jgi:hypothetical protein